MLIISATSKFVMFLNLYVDLYIYMFCVIPEDDQVDSPKHVVVQL